MTARISDNLTRGLFITILFLALLLHSCLTNAQSLRKKSGPRVYGFEVSFGTRSYKIESNIAELNNLAVLQEGGKAAIVAGTQAVKARLGIGYYYSAASMPHTFDRVETSASIIFNPLSLVLKSPVRFEPYISGGIMHHSNKLYGHYLNKDGAPVNYSTGEQPYVGKVTNETAVLGLGFEYKLLNDANFLSVFTEAQYGIVLTDRTRREALNETKVKNQMMIGLGIRYGAFR